MKFIELAQEIQARYWKYFPNSAIDISISPSIYHTFYVTPRLAKTIDEVANRIIGNDMFKIQISITYIDQPLQNGVSMDSEILEELQIEYDHSYYTIKPEIRHMAYGSRKVPARKSHGTPEKVIKTLDTYFARLRESLCKDIMVEAIHPNFITLLHSKL